MWHLKTLRKVEVVVQVFPFFFFCSGLRVSFYYMLNPLNEKQYDWSVKMFWQGCTVFKCLWEAVLISLLTYSWGETDILVYETFINRKTYWDNDKLARVHDRARWDTQTSTPVPTRKSTKKEKRKKGAGPRASFGPRRSTVWQICLTLHFLHNSLYFGPKWPAWSPWISMSRMSVWVSSVCFDACRRLCRFKSMAGLEEEGEAAAGYCWQRHLCHLINCNVYVTLRNVTEIGAPLSILSNFVTVPLPGKKLNKESSFWPLSDQRRSHVLAASPLTFTNKPEWKIRF